MSDMGDVEITLDGKSETLRSTVRAARAVNAMGGFGEVYRRLGAMDLEAYIVVVAAGLGKRVSDVEDAVWRTGLPVLAEPLANYVGLLANGGRPASGSVAATGEAYQADYFAWLLDDGMGVLGWPYDVVLDTPMPAIERALNARQKLIRNVLQSIFGKPDDKTPSAAQVSTRPMSPALFDALFPAHR